MSDIRILIADEEPRNLGNLRTILEQHGYFIVGESNNGPEVVALAQQLRPDIAVVDLKLPKLDGLEVARRLRDSSLAPVLLTATESNRDLVREAREAGVLGYIIKPIKEGDLMPIIEVARVRWQERSALQKELFQLRDKLETRKVIERAKGYLMDSQGLQEAEAFRKIQRLAMNSRRTMREVAQAILITQQIQP